MSGTSNSGFRDQVRYWTARAERAESRAATLEAELARARKVVEAADRWTAEYDSTGGDVTAVLMATHMELAADVRAYRASAQATGGEGRR